jgi:hypothetical protein
MMTIQPNEVCTEMSLPSSAPRNGAVRGKLRVSRGLAEWTIRAMSARASESYRDGGADLLYQACFSGRPPRITAHDGTIDVAYERGFFGFFGSSAADIELCAEIPWEIVIGGGASEVHADLRHLNVSSIEVRGGASDLEIELGEPRELVPIRVRGGVDQLTIVRPPKVPMRLRVRGGAADLSLDEQHFGAAGGLIALESYGFDAESAAYDLAIGGGASRLMVRER